MAKCSTPALEGVEEMTAIVTTGQALGPLLFVRLKPGMAGEAARSVHLTEGDPSGSPIEGPRGLRVLCGWYLQPTTYDVLSGLAGMPCARCALNSPGPEVRKLTG